MTIYNVHIYREMRFTFEGIEAETPEAAASIARDNPTSDADAIDDCEGESLSALVDLAGDEEYEHSRSIDFEPELLHKAVRRSLAALQDLMQQLIGVGLALESANDPELDFGQWAGSEGLSFVKARSAIVAANAAGIPAEPYAPQLLEALKGVIDYAENEAYSLEKLKDSPVAEEEAANAWKAVEAARVAIAEANAAGISPARVDIDIHALLAKRQQIAAIWSVEDVQENRPDLSDDAAWQVLQSVEHYHDCNYGITWDTLQITADHLFGSAPKTAESQGGSDESR